MDTPRPCGCKGCRTCLICENDYGINAKSENLEKEKSYIYCPLCNKAWPGWDYDCKKHPNHEGTPIAYPGVYIKLDFLNLEEEEILMEAIDKTPWDLSQSGRRKQNYGPKCNFKKNKLREGDFNGFPKFSKFVQDKFRDVPILKDFQCIEQCSLEYDPKRGASIDPHIDDCWVWGERIVTVNLLADSVLTMTYNKKSKYYNLHCVQNYAQVLRKSGDFDSSGECFNVTPYSQSEEYPLVRIPMPRRSLLVLFNSARYDWEHRVLREDIGQRRVCLAYREFTPTFLIGGEKYEEAKNILTKAKHFWDCDE